MLVVLALALLLAQLGAATPAATACDRWTVHDPDFPVRIGVSPFGDSEWDLQSAELGDTLAIPSTVLNISVRLPPLANVTTTQVCVTVFGEKEAPVDEPTGAEHTSAGDDVRAPAFVVLADTLVQYATSYRVNVGTRAQRMTLRVYVESQLKSGRTMRAMFARPLDLSPSEPLLLECPSTSQADMALQITSYPPTNMPLDLCRGYTMDSRVPVRKWYFDDTDTERTYEERSFEFIEELIDAARKRKRYYYDKTDGYLYAALAKFPIRGKHVLIVGSTTPWYEAICVAMEAASCTTIDYNKLRYNHPKIQTYTVGEFESVASMKQFDAIFSISSFEHDGLGRYGDPLDPDADLKAMKDLLRYTKPTNTRSGDTTKVFLAVPVGADVVVWNAQRIYGPLRLPMLLQVWSLAESFGFAKADFNAPFTVTHQPLFVLEPKMAASQQGSGHSEL